MAGNLFIKSIERTIRSIFTPWFWFVLAKVVILPLIGIIFIAVFFGGTFYDTIYNFLASFTQKDFWLVVFKFASFLIIGIGFLLLYLSAVIVIVSMSLDLIISPVRKKYYPQIDLRGFRKGFRTTASIILRTVFYYSIYILLSPLLLIPVINMIFPIIFTAYLLDKTLLYEVSSIVLTKEEYHELLKLKKDRIILGLLGGISELIPLAFIFTPFLQAILYTHFVFLFAENKR